MTAGLRIGITPWRHEAAAPASLWVDQAVRAEALGFHSFWLPESHFAGQGSNPSPLLPLAAVAACTKSLRVATTSYLLSVRNAVQTAEEVAVLDCLSGGRLILGVGRGFRPALFAAYGQPETGKRDRFEAALTVMRDAWEGKPVVTDEAEGGVILSPLPIQQPHPPIWAAAFGPKALSLSGRLGLPYLCSPIEPFERLRENYARHREAVVEAHGEIELPVPVMRTVFAHPDAAVRERASLALDRQARTLARAASRRVRDLGSPELADWALVGEPADVEDRLGRHGETLGMTHLVVRTQIPGVDEAEVLAALDHLAALAPGA